jgi:hypothetical protein
VVSIYRRWSGSGKLKGRKAKLVAVAEYPQNAMRKRLLISSKTWVHVPVEFNLPELDESDLILGILHEMKKVVG